MPVQLTLGLAAMIRFFAAAKDKQDIQEMFYSVGFVVLVASLILYGILFLFALLTCFGKGRQRYDAVTPF